MREFLSSLRVRLAALVLIAVVPALTVTLYKTRQEHAFLRSPPAAQTQPQNRLSSASVLRLTEDDTPLTWDLTLILVASGLALIAAWVAADVFVLHPLGQVADAARRLSGGDFGARAALGKAGGEIGQLGRTFNDMAQTLEERTIDLLRANGDLQFEVVERKRAEEALRRDQAALRETERRFRETLENVNLVSVGLAPSGEITFCNDLLLRVTGWERDEILGKDWFELFVTEGKAEKKVFVEAVQRGSVFPHFENEIQTRDGRTRFVAWSNVVLRDPDGGIAGTVSIGDDVTEQREAARQLMVRNRQLSALFDISRKSTHSLGLTEVLRGGLEAAVDALGVDAGAAYLGEPEGPRATLRAQVLRSPGDEGTSDLPLPEGWTPESRLNRLPFVVDLTAAPDAGRAALSGSFATLAATPLLADDQAVGVLHFLTHQPRLFSPEEIEVLATVGQLLGSAVQKASLYEQVQRELAEKAAAVAALAQANAQLEESRAALHDLAVRDELTGLYNRREMNRLLEEETARLDRYGQPVGLVILDIDHFKTLNDTYGHGAGDEALRWVAGLLRKTLRAADRPVRYGGDELVVILPGVTAPKAFQMAERLQRLVARSTFPLSAGEGQRVTLTLSIGTAGLPEHGTSGEELLVAADRALYEAKRLGRNRTVAYSPSLAAAP